MTSSPTTEQNFARRLQQLRQKFVDGLPARILFLEQKAIELRAGGKDTGAIAAIKGECHKLAGVAASFGFENIGTRASEIDQAITSGKLGRDELGEALEELMNEMEELLDNAQNDR